MRPRVVILSAFLTPLRSGAEACAEEVALRLAERFDITIVTARMRRNLPIRETFGNVPVMRVGIGHPMDKWLYPFLAPFAARRLKPEIVHAILESYAGLAMILCRWICPGAKRVLTCQSTNTSLFLRVMHWNAHRVTAISSTLVRRAMRYGRGDVERIPNGVDVARFAQARAQERRIDGRILFVGRLEWMKGVDTLIEAFRMLANEFPGTELRIVGDGSQRSELEARAGNLLSSGRITFTGRMDPHAIAAEYARAPIFCGLSRSEALGNVFLEAQAAGCAVVATRVGGIHDAVLDKATGFLIPADHPDLAADALRLLLRHPEKAKTMGEAGIANAAKYDWGIIAEQYERVYEKMAAPQ
jgi:glycosyltransferase involved in cell wall biosynthesis